MKKKLNFIMIIVVVFFMVLTISCKKNKNNSDDTLIEKNITCEIVGEPKVFKDAIFNRSSVIIYVNYSNNTKKDITYDSDTVFTLNTSNLGTNTCQVSYHDMTTSFTFNVVSPEVVGVSVYQSEGTKTQYLVGERLDLTNYYVYFTYEDNSTAPATALLWQLRDPNDNVIDLNDKFTAIGTYTLFANYSIGAITYSSYVNFEVTYNELSSVDIDKILSDANTDRIHVTSETIIFENDTTKISLNGEYRTFIESRDDSGPLNINFNNNTYNSRITLGNKTSNSKFTIETTTSISIEFIIDMTDGRLPIIESTNGSITPAILSEGNLKLISVNLEAGVYELTSSNASLYLYGINIIY